MRFTLPYSLADMRPKATRKAFAELQRVILQSWRDYNEALRPLLPSPLDRMLDFNFQDSPLCTVRWSEETKILTILMWDGPRLANEYIPWYLTYHGVEMMPASRRLLAYLATDAGADVANLEIDIVSFDETPVFAHRILWYTDFAETTELEIRFRAFDLQMGHQPMAEMYRLYPEDNVDVDKLAAGG